ncbi:MAG: molecular chaperone DjiA [Pseudomonadota bacterium]
MTFWERLKDTIRAIGRGESIVEALDRLRGHPERSIAFTIAVIALGAKMAKADGRVTRDEIAAFREVFHIPPDAEAEAARVYNLARTDVAGFDTYAQRVQRMFEDRPEVLADLLEGLCHIAAADGEFHPDEESFLDEVARIFAVAPGVYTSIKARQIPGAYDPFAVLGVAPDIEPSALRRHYRALVKTLHPDSLMARGIPAEARALSEQRLAQVNAAYAEITGASSGPDGAVA